MKSIKGIWVPFVDMENSTRNVCCLILVQRIFNKARTVKTSRRRGEDFYFPGSEAIPILEGNASAKKLADAAVEKYFALFGGEK